jgi:hypothetical protein
MAGIFGGGRVNNGNPVATGIRVQGSIQGNPRNIGAGQNRVAGTLIWYGDFSASPQKQAGKGGGGSSGKGTTGSYNYSSSFIVSLGEGPISGVQSIINGNQIDFFTTPSATILADLAALGVTVTYGNTYGATFLTGSYTQSPWSYLTSAHPTQALAYRGQATACFPNLALGSSSSIPNFNFEILWGINSDIPAYGPDANGADWITAYLSSADWGIGFPSALIGDLTAYRTWCRATGMLISPAVTSSQAGQSHLQDLMQATVSDFRWSSGLLTVVPYGDQSVTGNGYTYTPNVSPVYALTTQHFMSNQGTLGATTATGKTSVSVQRKDPATVLNQIRVEYLDRGNLYNPVIIYDQDDSAIIQSGRKRASDVRAFHFFCDGRAASMSASLQLRREHVVTTYQFTLPASFILLDCLDIVTITEPNLGLNAQPVRIIEIQENSDHSLTITAEEFLGTVGAPIYARQQSLGAAINTNADPGNINAPVIFELPDAYSNGLEISVAVSGQNPAAWGGYNVYVAYEPGGTYALVGTVTGPARTGLLTSALSSVPTNAAGQTIDNANTLAVTLAQSNGSLASATAIDMTSLNTACYVGGEVISYQTATLTGANAYNLSPMVRGAYGTTIAAHAAGTQFARLDSQILTIPYTQNRIGTTLYLKFQSFNIYGGGLQNLSTLSPYTYTIAGTALASPMPNPSNLRTVFNAGVMQLYWDEVSDFRPTLYQIRKGSTWASSITVATLAHPPFTVIGDDTYWVSAVSQPTAGLTVYSATPQSLTVSGSLLSQNIVKTWDEQATGWTGTFSSGVITVGTNPSAFVALNGSTYTGTYTIPTSHIVNVGYVAQCLIGASFVGTGAPAGQNILTVSDFLGDADLLGSASSQFVDVHLEIQTSSSAIPDIFSVGDVFNPGTTGNDVFSAGQVWSPWQKFVPGVYVGSAFNMRLVLTTQILQAIPYGLGFKFSVTVPNRIDHYLAQSVPSTGLAITFKVDGTSSAAPFNGGPNNSTLPAVQVSYQGQTGDTWSLTSFTGSGLTITFYNSSGTAVARTADIIVQGY